MKAYIHVLFERKRPPKDEITSLNSIFIRAARYRRHAAGIVRLECGGADPKRTRLGRLSELAVGCREAMGHDPREPLRRATC